MKVGITGTREGMTESQFASIKEALKTIISECGAAEFHHGDCTGVDVEAAFLAKELGYKIICHPPKSSEQQGYFGGDEMREPLGYLQRDRNIVDETDILIVAPLQRTHQSRGGTWYTHDYALKKGKPIMLFIGDKE
jgi:hypothetical protein